MAPSYILGISAFYHDSAAALLVDGEIVAAASEERFTRKKGDASFPTQAVAYCLREGGIGIDGLAAVGFYEKPILKFDRILETFVGAAPRGFSQFMWGGPLWINEKLWLDRELRAALGGYRGELLYAEHHESHAASAFYPSPYDSAAVLTMDGVGEWTTTSVGFGEAKDLKIYREIFFPHSLGLLYSAFTYYLGFKVNSGEYKVMGLAPYGEPKYAALIRDNLLELKPDGSFRLNLAYFDYCTGLRMTNPKFADLMGPPPRKSDEWLTQRHMDIAASLQAVTEEVVDRLVDNAVSSFGTRTLCLAGGVALNCVANGKVL